MPSDDIVEKLQRKIRRVREAKERTFISLSNEIRVAIENAPDRFIQRDLFSLLKSVDATKKNENEEIIKLLKPKLRRIK